MEAARGAGALFSDALMSSSVRGSIAAETDVAIARCASGHEITLRRVERPPRCAPRRDGSSSCNDSTVNTSGSGPEATTFDEPCEACLATRELACRVDVVHRSHGHAAPQMPTSVSRPAGAAIAS